VPETVPAVALIGYARVSITEEETWRQHDVLQEAGCARIFTDRASGAHEERPELARALDHLREGDTLVVWRLDRLARSLRDLVDTVAALGERGIELRSLAEKVDTAGPAGPHLLHLCTCMSAFELDLVQERTALAALGVREPRINAIREAARSLPLRRDAAAEPAEPAEPAGATAATVDDAPSTLRGRRRATVATATDAASPPRRRRPTVGAPPDAAPSPPPRSRRRHRVRIALQVVASAAAAFAAFQVAHSDAQSPALALSHTASNPDVVLRYPDGWRRSSSDLAVADLGLDDPIVLTPGRAGGAMIMVGMSPATGATLLPGGVARRLSQTPAAAQVRLGRLRAYHYANLRVDGLTRRMTVFAVPTSAGALTMACLTPPRDAATARSVCLRVAQSLRLRRGHALALGPSRGYQQHLNQLVKALDETRIARRAELVAARSPAEQVRIAEALATAFARARATGARARPSPREAAADRRILAAVDAGASAYQQLAQAASIDSVARYDDARTDVRRGEHRLRAALGALTKLGYQTSAAGRPRGS
jgi:DNA invertase Pin-like site-specific DNA recombinase